MNAIANQLTHPHPHPSPARLTARDRLTGRVLTIASCEIAQALVLDLDPRYEGLVITGADRHRILRKLLRARGDLLLIAESDSHLELEATPERCWHLPGAEDEGLFAGPTVLDILEAQRTSGAQIVLLPSGYVEVGDPDTIRSIVDAANLIEGDDIALPLYLASAWLRTEYRDFLVELIKSSTHPVLLAFGSDKNPLDGKKKLLLYRDIVAASGAFSWRVDLAGLDAFAHGGMGAAIGSAPALRRVTPPKEKGNARRPDDPTPYVMSQEHMHYMKTGAMKEELYIGLSAPDCGCRECNGRKIDRFTEKQKASSARHNHAVIDTYAQKLLAALPSARAIVWRDLAQDAVVAHEATAAVVGRPWNPPKDVTVFSEA